MADPVQAHVSAEWKHPSPQISCRFEPQARFVFAGAMDNTIVRWRLADGQATVLAGGHDSWVKGLAFDAAGDVLVSGGYDGRLIWWNAAADAPSVQRKVDAHNGWIRYLATSPDGQTLASAGNDKLVKLWSLADGSLKGELQGHETQVHSVAFHPTGQFLFSGDLKGNIKQWDLSTGQEVRQMAAGELYKYEAGQGVDFGGVRGLAVSRDGQFVAGSGTTDASNPLGAIHKPIAIVFQTSDGARKQLQRAKDDVNGVFWNLQFHPAGYAVAGFGGGAGGFLYFLKPEEPQEFARFALPNLARDMDLASDGLRVATVHADAHLRITTLAPKPAA
jgi:WD40 repeat protein